MQKTNSKVVNLCMIGLFTAVMAVMAQIAIPTPVGVPITLQTFAIILAGIILGSKNGAVASIIYILIGAIGLPVFSNFTGGWQYIIGPTGGFILSFPLMAFIVGFAYEHKNKWHALYFLGIIFGSAINFTCGVVTFCALTKSELISGFAICALPFIPGEIIKIFLASVLGTKIRKRLTI